MINCTLGWLKIPTSTVPVLRESYRFELVWSSLGAAWSLEAVPVSVFLRKTAGSHTSRAAAGEAAPPCRILWRSTITTRMIHNYSSFDPTETFRFSPHKNKNVHIWLYLFVRLSMWTHMFMKSTYHSSSGKTRKGCSPSSKHSTNTSCFKQTAPFSILYSQN